MVVVVLPYSLQIVTRKSVMEICIDATITICMVDSRYCDDNSIYEHKRPLWWRISTFSYVLVPECELNNNHCSMCFFLVSTPLYRGLLSLIRSFLPSAGHVGFTYTLVLNLDFSLLSRSEKPCRNCV